MTTLKGEYRMPTIHELGDDLLAVSWTRRVVTLATPVVASGSYFVFAWRGWWVAAVLSVMVLSFFSYGSTSHDLVHRTLGLPRSLNDLLLSVLELTSFRSGTAYRLTHLHHHAHTLEDGDVEGAAAHGTLFGAILSGPLMQGRLWMWVWRMHSEARMKLLLELTGIVGMIVGAIVISRWNLIPLIYVGLVVGGSWVFPLVTVYIPHDAKGTTALTRTRLFRGWFSRVMALDHLYHLEHHLYPAVPHHHWKRLADRLDPYLRGSV